MKKQIVSGLSTGFFLMGMVQMADAALVSRLDGQVVYDSDRDITWLANTNAGAGSEFDNGASTTDGRMTWENANLWVNSLTIGGFTDWRLPTPEIGCSAFNCNQSEMGHLFYDELAGRGGSSILNSQDPDLALFTHIEPDFYWSTEFRSAEAWNFHFGFGTQPANGKDNEFFIWAVRSGEISAVPIPATAWLFGSGLIALLGLVRYKK